MSYTQILSDAQQHNAKLIAVSKTQPIDKIKTLYDQGQRDFGENRVQEILLKKPQLPDDIRWHLIGQLQTNKVKKIIDQVVMIQSIDSTRLLDYVQKEAAKKELKIDVLLQIHIAEEQSKSGMQADEMKQILCKIKEGNYSQVNIRGLMGITTLTEDRQQIRSEFRNLHQLLEEGQTIHPEMDILSMGMSGDYSIALEEGSTMIRVGSLIFGTRN